MHFGVLVLIAGLAALPEWNAFPDPKAETSTEPGAPETLVREELVPGAEPHSPATVGNAAIAPANVRRAAGAFGGGGLLHLSSADLGPVGLLRFGAFGEFLSQGDFPVLGANDSRAAATFAISWVPWSFLETYLSFAASANSSSRTQPAVIQALGDLSLGAKLSRKWATGTHAGAEGRLTLFSRAGQNLGSAAVGASGRLLFLHDFLESSRLPLRALVNAGITSEGTGTVTSTAQLTASEEFALGAHRYSRITAGAGLEAPLPWVTPFVEYGLALPLGVSGGTLVGPDGAAVEMTQALPQTLSLGLRVTAVRDLTFTAAMDLGLSTRVGLGIPATAPWNFLFGVGYATNPFQKADVKLVEKVREKKIPPPPAPPRGSKLAGVVLDAKTQKPIAGVILALQGSGLPPVASEAESGRFLTQELMAGKVTLAALRDGYQPFTQELNLQAGSDAQVELYLEPVAKVSRLSLTATADKKPVAAKVKVRGARPLEVQTGIDGPTFLEVPTGVQVLEVTAPGFLTQTREVQVGEAATVTVALELLAEPKKKLVIIRDNKIEILQQVHFGTGNAEILADSHGLLAQVVDAILQTGLHKIRVEGHTDNRGGKLKNLRLSQERAAAVGSFLEKAGIESVRLEVQGCGDSRPIAPNLTARGRELNRRVEFVIVER